MNLYLERRLRMRNNFKEVENMLDELVFLKTANLIKSLAIGFNRDTKRIAVPNGTRNWWIVCSDGRTINVELIPFFGMAVGYNNEFDILVISE